MVFVFFVFEFFILVNKIGNDVFLIVLMILLIFCLFGIFKFVFW